MVWFIGFILFADFVNSNESNMLTVRINTFRRNDLLKSSISHYLTCNVILEVQIIWSDIQNQPPLFKDLNDDSNKVRYEIHDKDSLNNRFLAKIDIKTKV